MKSLFRHFTWVMTTSAILVGCNEEVRPQRGVDQMVSIKRDMSIQSRMPEGGESASGGTIAPNGGAANAGGDTAPSGAMTAGRSNSNDGGRMSGGATSPTAGTSMPSGGAPTSNPQPTGGDPGFAGRPGRAGAQPPAGGAGGGVMAGAPDQGGQVMLGGRAVVGGEPENGGQPNVAGQPDGGGNGVDPCTCMVGQQRCIRGDLFQICRSVDGEICPEWGPIRQCPAGNLCIRGACGPRPDECVDECVRGAFRCTNETTRETCGDWDDDVCFEWGNPKLCPPETICGVDQCIPVSACDNPLPARIGRSIGQPLGMSSLEGRCGGNGAEVVFEFTAPDDATYRFGTEGSAGDTVLYIRSTCNDIRTEVACGNAMIGNRGEQLDQRMNANETIAVIVDTIGNVGGVVLEVSQLPAACQDECAPGEQECFSPGQYRVCLLNRNTNCHEWSIPVACAIGERCAGNRCGPAAEGPCGDPLVGRLGVQRGIVEGASDAVGSCGGAGSEQVIAFTAPEAGNYRFDTNGSAFDTVLHGRLACTLPETEVGCDNQSPGSFEHALIAGQTIYLFVDGEGAGGEYTLNIERAAQCADECILNTLSCADEANVQRCADFDGDGCTEWGNLIPCGPAEVCNEGACLNPNDEAGTCANPLRAVVGAVHRGETPQRDNFRSNACPSSGGDVVYRFDPPRTGVYSFDTEGSAFDTVIYARGICDQAEPEIGCNDDAVGADIGDFTSAFSIAFRALSPLYIIVDGLDILEWGNYNLNVNRLGDYFDSTAGRSCQDAANLTVGNHSVTVPPGGQYEGSCGGGAMRVDAQEPGESVFRFRAPQQGVYIFSAFSNAVSPVLYLRSACEDAADELLCDNAADNLDGFPGAIVGAFLRQGDAVYLFVDGEAVPEDVTIDVNVRRLPSE